MIERLLNLSVTDLSDLAMALRAGRLSPPYTPVSLQRVLPENSAAVIAAELSKMAGAGFTPLQIAAALELIVCDRRLRPRLEDEVELVTTGPEVQGIANRDTSVVVRELFANANESVLIAGFAIYQGQRVFQALADRMLEKPDLRVRVFVDIQRPVGDTTIPRDLITRFAERFLTQQWPQDRPLPSVLFDPRSLDASTEKRACMHAKSVVVDGHFVFVSSANFTEAAQQRNIEVGVLMRSTAVALRLTRFFDAMQNEGMFTSVL